MKMTSSASYLKITVTDESKRQIRQLIGSTIDTNISKLETGDEKLKELDSYSHWPRRNTRH